jgi:uncharacterized membrane protein
MAVEPICGMDPDAGTATAASECNGIPAIPRTGPQEAVRDGPREAREVTDLGGRRLDMEAASIGATEESRVGLRKILRTMTWSKPLFALFIVALFWTVSLFVVPFTLPPGTVKDLNGYANRVDHAHLWATLPPYQQVIYYLGDVQCHQISSRTIYLNGNEMPVDSRVTSIYVFGTVGILGAMFVKPSPDAGETLMRVFPRRIREAIRRTLGFSWFIPIFIVLMLLPVALDGGIQMLTAYESDNVKRVLTGIPAGLVAGLLLGALLLSTKQFAIHLKTMRERLEQRQPVEDPTPREFKRT